jgi:hypothetical protein
LLFFPFFLLPFFFLLPVVFVVVLVIGTADGIG